MMNIELEKYEEREDLRLDELLEAVNGLMEAVAPVQPSDRVTETLSERTVRYYISEGLVDRPSGREGVSALYGYRHLLQLLALKRLQVSYFPMKRIREIIPNSTNDELKEILLDTARQEAGALSSTSTRDRALSFLDSISPNLPASRASQRAGSPPAPPPVPAVLSSSCVSGGTALPPSPELWERFVLDDGIELHIRADRRSSLRKSELRRLLDGVSKLFFHAQRGKREKPPSPDKNAP